MQHPYDWYSAFSCWRGVGVGVCVSTAPNDTLAQNRKNLGTYGEQPILFQLYSALLFEMARWHGSVNLNGSRWSMEPVAREFKIEYFKCNTVLLNWQRQSWRWCLYFDEP